MARMRIVHFADLHIGVENYGRPDPETGLSTRLGDFLQSLDAVVETAIGEGADLALLAGDAYKGRDPSQTQQRALAQRLARLSQAGIPTFLLVGNHDLPAARSRATAVEIFPTLAVPQVYVGGSLAVYPIATPAGPLQVLAVPWPRRSELLGADETRGLSIDEIRRQLEDRMTRGIAARAAALNPEIPAILAGHLTVNGAAVGSERSMMLGDDHMLYVSALAQPNLDYVALGHIHRHQVIYAGPPMVVYAGSLQRVDFSEEDDEKGFCIIDLDPQAPPGQRMTGFEFRKLPARPFVTIDAAVAPGDDDPTAAVLQAIGRREVAGAVVRVRITLPPEAVPHLRESEIRQALAPAHYLAAIATETTGARRTRLSPDSGEGLQPLGALELYFQSRSTPPERQQQLLTRAQQLLSEGSDAIKN